MAIPRPMTIIANVASSQCCACAQPKAAAKTPKPQGVLSIAARKPVARAPEEPDLPTI